MITQQQRTIIQLLARQAVNHHLTSKPQQPCGSEPNRSNRPVQIEQAKR